MIIQIQVDTNDTAEIEEAIRTLQNLYSGRDAILSDVMDKDEATTSFGMANGSTLTLVRSDEQLSGLKSPVIIVDKDVTEEDVIDATRNLLNTKGMPAALALLEQFGAKKATEVALDKRDDFVAAAKAAIYAK